MSESHEWFQDESLWELTQPILFTPELWEAATANIEKICTLLRLDPSTAILDLCCGPGRYAIPLAAKGYRVTAVDRTRCFLSELRTRATDAALDIEIIESDMREFCRPDAYDAAIFMLTSFGYFEDPEDDIRVLRNLFASIKPGGRLLVEITPREWLTHTFQARDWLRHDDRFLLCERRFVDSFARLHNHWIVIHGSLRREWEFNLRLYGASDLCALFQKVGFSSATAMGNLDGAPCDFKCSRLYVAATK